MADNVIYKTSGFSPSTHKRGYTDAEWKYIKTSLFVHEATVSAASDLSSYFEPVTNGDADFPEIVFHDGDVVMHEVPL